MRERVVPQLLRIHIRALCHFDDPLCESGYNQRRHSGICLFALDARAIISVWSELKLVSESRHRIGITPSCEAQLELSFGTNFAFRFNSDFFNVRFNI